MVSRDTSDPAEVESQEEMAEVRRYIETDMLAQVLDTFEGRHVLNNILRAAGIDDDFFDPDVAATNRFLGKRSLGLLLQRDILTAKPNALIVMKQEAEAFDAKYQAPELRKDEDDVD
jgi:hypothetical protein